MHVDQQPAELCRRPALWRAQQRQRDILLRLAQPQPRRHRPRIRRRPLALRPPRQAALTQRLECAKVNIQQQLRQAIRGRTVDQVVRGAQQRPVRRHALDIQRPADHHADRQNHQRGSDLRRPLAPRGIR